MEGMSSTVATRTVWASSSGGGTADSARACGSGIAYA